MTNSRAKIAVIIVSYRNPADVVRCLKSLAHSDWTDFEVFICENGGPAAFDHLAMTLCGPEGTLERCSRQLDDLALPDGRLASVMPCNFRSRPNLVYLAAAAENLGYAGGINAWLERFLSHPGWDAILILNPDTEVGHACLGELMSKASEGFGMVGGTLVFDHSPEKIINYGLIWSRMTGRIIAAGRNARAGSSPSAKLLKRLDAISGACVLVTRAFVEEVGFMTEDYFLYIEDLDWGRRRGRHRIGFAARAIIKHIGGTTIGTSVDMRMRSSLSVYLTARNRILYGRRSVRVLWVFHFVIGLMEALRYLVSNSPRNAKFAFIGLIDGVRGRSGRPEI